ncbi:hypothetical protein SAMN05444320_102527 [Streptoalloteichus hindustanus]|uniref:Uncharacterized protein n=1 Tax=Streptoalloteichus hindustanus TaxID=2017 RepID=A0A1M4YXY9_STRHI|nr:hypothetical protein SAMN05444320_102527 [Streptoalloteichus hindustanus]
MWSPSASAPLPWSGQKYVSYDGKTSARTEFEITVDASGTHPVVYLYGFRDQVGPCRRTFGLVRAVLVNPVVGASQ